MVVTIHVTVSAAIFWVGRPVAAFVFLETFLTAVTERAVVDDDGSEKISALKISWVGNLQLPINHLVEVDESEIVEGK